MKPLPLKQCLRFGLFPVSETSHKEHYIVCAPASTLPYSVRCCLSIIDALLCICNLPVDSHRNSHKLKKHKNTTVHSQKNGRINNASLQSLGLFLASTSSSFCFPSHLCLLFPLLHPVPLFSPRSTSSFLSVPPVSHAPRPLLSLVTPPPTHHCHRHLFTCRFFPPLPPWMFLSNIYQQAPSFLENVKNNFLFM